MSATQEYCTVQLKNQKTLYMASEDGLNELRKHGAIVDLRNSRYSGGESKTTRLLKVLLNVFAGALALDKANKTGKEKLIIHCKHGRERTPAVVICYYIWVEGKTYDQAQKIVYNQIKETRNISVNSAHNIAFNQLLENLSQEKINSLLSNLSGGKEGFIKFLTQSIDTSGNIFTIQKMRESYFNEYIRENNLLLNDFYEQKKPSEKDDDMGKKKESSEKDDDMDKQKESSEKDDDKGKQKEQKVHFTRSQQKPWSDNDSITESRRFRMAVEYGRQQALEDKETVPKPPM